MLLVKSETDLQAALAFVLQHEVLAYDTETTGLNPRQDKVIGFGVSTEMDGFYFPIWSYDTASEQLVSTGLDPQPILQALAQKKLLMFNASFDARFTKFNLGVDLVPALHCDVLLLKHTCDEEFPFGLKEISTKLWGTDAKAEKVAMQESIKANGGSAHQYYKADLSLMAAYCVQDCRLTYRLYNFYSRDLERQGLQNFFYEDEVLPLYKELTIPMEERGVRLDMPKLSSALIEISADLEQLEASIQSAITPNLALFTKWFLNKDYPAKTFTGKVPVWAKKHATQADAWLADAGSDAYMFNLLSKHHLKKLFFDTLDCVPLSKTPTGQPQVNDEFLQSVREQYAWVPLLQDYNKLTKLKGTYIERLLHESENGRFYPSFQQHRTVSGRYAGDLQQLPRPLEVQQASELVRKHNNRVREFIVPDEGSMLVSADYEQLEPSVFAHTSGDQALKDIFISGDDFYSTVAIRTEGISSVSADKNAANYLGKVDKPARQKAKTYALGIAYGMSGYKLKFEIGTNDIVANQLVIDYLTAFPKLAEWMNESQAKVRADGRISTQSGRVRHMPAAVRLHARYGAAFQDSLQLWKQFNAKPVEYAKAKQDYREYKNLMNNAINFQVQGLAASIVNRAAIALTRELKAQGLQAAVCMQVHDELVLNVPQNEIDCVCALTKLIMETNMKLSVPLRTVPQTGANFKECK